MQTGGKIGHYEIREKIGSGGMGEVYLAQDTELDRLVALKVLRTATAKDSEVVSRFVREAKAASALNHPNILTVHEIGTFEGARFITTEYIKGETLRERFKGESLKLREALDIILQVAAALDAAHNAGIVHRDIKPENIMLRDDGLAKVLDFGLAKLSEPVGGSFAADDATQFETRPGVFLGTPHYVSPEQARARKVDARSDVWSTGVVLYEMLTNQRPFPGETLPDTIASILTKDPEPLGESIPPELARIIKKSLEKKPDERYQTIKDFLIDVKNLKRELEFSEELERSHHSGFTRAAYAGATQNLSTTGFVVREVGKHKFAFVAALLLLLIGSGGFAYWYINSSSTPGISSIAVLPFANVGNDPNNEYLSDGVSESLINNLSRLPQLKVIARSSAFKYKGQEIDPQEVAKALGVEAIVTGRVQQREDTLSISVEMINAADKTQMWGETYNRRVADAQNIQEEIVRRVSEKLRLTLSGKQEQQLAKPATQSSQAYQLYLNGLFYSRKGGAENVRKSLEFSNKALELDPNFALAHVGVAAAYNFLGANSLMEPQEANAKMKAAVQKALELDETLSDAYVIIASMKRNEWDWKGAEGEYRRALDLNPSLARAHRNYAIYLSALGRPGEAFAEIRRAREFDPLDPSISQVEGQLLYEARRYDDAIPHFQNILKTDPEDTFSHSFLGYTYAAKGQYAEAIGEYKTSMEIDGENSGTQCYMGYALAKSGKRNEAVALLDKLKASTEYVSPTELAALYAGLGDSEQALKALEKAYEAHDLALQYLKVDPHYDSLRTDPRFADLLRRVGLPE